MSTTETLPEIGSIEPNTHGYRTFTLGELHVQPRRLLRPRRVAQGPSHAAGRRLPARAAARHRVGLLLRHRELRRGGRHREPLRLRRSLRRPLQRALPQGGARPQRALHHPADPARVRGHPRGLDQRRLRSVREPAGDGQRVRAEERQQQGGDHPPPRHGQAHDRRARRRAGAQRRERLPDQPPLHRRAAGRARGARRARLRGRGGGASTSSPISRAPT